MWAAQPLASRDAVSGGAYRAMEDQRDRYRDERDRWIRLFNRLEAAVSHHKKDKSTVFVDEVDEALYAARDHILRDAAGTTTDDAPAVFPAAQLDPFLRAMGDPEGALAAVTSLAKRVRDDALDAMRARDAQVDALKALVGRLSFGTSEESIEEARKEARNAGLGGESARAAFFARWERHTFAVNQEEVRG